MLKKKLLRDIWKNKSQFITIFAMVLIGVMVYVGIEAYTGGMKNASISFYQDYNLQDLNLIGASGYTKYDLEEIKNIESVTDVERLLSVNATDDTGNITYFLNFIESNNIDKFYIVDGIPFDINTTGAWVDEFYAKENNLSVGDTITIKYDTLTFEEKIVALINVPDHLFDLKDASSLMPNRKESGFVYLSIKELPEDYVKKEIINSLKNEQNINLTLEEFNLLYPDFDYYDYAFYYLIVDVDNKDNVDKVKSLIEEKNNNTIAVTKIEDTISYSMYEGEMNEGEAFVGIFSGLFLGIALLSVITTMTRVIKKEKMQIGTLKALGFSNFKVIKHYVGYGFWVSLIGAIFGIIAGRYFIGNVFMTMEMQYFELPNNGAIIVPSSYLVAVLVVIVISLVTYLTCRKELIKKPADTLRQELPNIKNGSLNITTKNIFKKLNFTTIWNLRDILRNKFRTLTAIIGVSGCSLLIVCALGMLNSMNHFIDLQFQKLYNFNYKLTLKNDLDNTKINELLNTYGNNSSQTLGIVYEKDNNTTESNTIFVTNANDLVRFLDNNENYIEINNNDGIYVTYKLAETNNYKIGDTIKWHIYGQKEYYESTIVGFNKDPQNQNITMTKEYLESLGITYKPDSIYTNNDLSNTKEIESVELISSRDNLRNDLESMMSMMMTMIIIIVFFAILLGIIIISNMSILSFSEKQYQFATLKVLGFKDKKIKNIFIKQNIWIIIISIIIGLPLGYYLTSYLFVACLEDNFDFGTYILPSTYLISAIITFLTSYIVSNILANKITKIDMVTSLKGNE